MIHQIYPLNDLKDHNLEDTTCECNPDIMENDGDIFVINNSFDGREGFEMANEILEKLK